MKRRGFLGLFASAPAAMMIPAQQVAARSLPIELSPAVPQPCSWPIHSTMNLNPNGVTISCMMPDDFARLTGYSVEEAQEKLLVQADKVRAEWRAKQK